MGQLRLPIRQVNHLQHELLVAIGSRWLNTTAELAAQLGEPFPRVASALRALRAAGLVLGIQMDGGSRWSLAQPIYDAQP